MSSTRDPLGKRALFSVETRGRAPGTVDPNADGMEAHRPISADDRFDAARPRLGTVVVSCSECRARTRLTLADLLGRSLPLPLWNPLSKHSRLLRCPSCEVRTWAHVDWLG